MKRTGTASVRIPDDELDEIEKKVKSFQNPDGEFATISQCIRECTKMGLRLLDYQKMMKDPTKSKEFQEKMQDIIKEEKIFDWTQTLTPEQINAFLMALQMEKDSRYDNRKLL